jgi:hypothetical protein
MAIERQGPDGAPIWKVPLQGTQVRLVEAYAGRIYAGYSTGQDQPFVYETRDPASGALLLRYAEGPADEA